MFDWILGVTWKGHSLLSAARGNCWTTTISPASKPHGHSQSMLGRDDIIIDHARAYWHEAGHVLVARKLDVPVAGVIYTNLKRLPDNHVSGNLVTAYYFTSETNPVRRAAEQAEWVRHFGIDKVCTATAGGTAAEEIYAAPAELALEDGDRKSV